VLLESQRLSAQRAVEVSLIGRRRDEEDQRLVRLWLTDAGRALQKPIEAERRRLEEAVTANVTASERRHLLKALAKVHESARQLLDDDSAISQGSKRRV